MLRILEGGFYSTAYERFKEEISQLVKKRERVYLVVPEQQAVITEREMLQALPESAPLFFEVTNFTRLANTVYRSVGGISGEYADKGKEALIMWKTLTELSPVLDMTSKSGEINTGTVEKAMAAVSEMKSISALPQELAALAESSEIKENSRLISKLRDISKIMSLYNSLLEKRYTSTRDECERLAAKLVENPNFFKGAHFFLTGFTSFTEPQYKVICELMRYSRLTVHLTISKHLYGFFEFTEIKGTKERLLRIADKIGEKKELVRAETPLMNQGELLPGVCELLWRSFGELSGECLDGCGEVIRIFEAKDPYEMCEFTAADIKKKVMAGARLCDFAIIARDAKKYVGLIDTALQKADIPCFISKRKDVTAYEPIKLIYTAFSVAVNGFRREDVISYAKCRLCGVEAEACDEFELYTEKWQITKERFTDGVFWNMSPGGYSTRVQEGAEDALIRIDNTRNAIISPLLELADNVKEAKVVRELAAALVKFLTDISLEEKIEKRRAELLSLGEADAEDYARLWELICSSLDSLVEVLGDTETDARSFLMLLGVILGEANIGRIPAHYDEVTVGSADMIRLSEKKHIYLIGVNHGEFPSPASEKSYFTERDKIALAALGLNADTNADIAHARELFFFSRAFAAAKKSVTLLYSTRTEAFSSSARAEIIDRISDICAGKVKPVKISELAPIEKIYFPEMAFELIENPGVKKALSEAGFDRETEILNRSVSNLNIALGDESRKVIYSGDLALTQTRIDAYVGCPFAYYLRYNVKLAENERAEFDARNIGSFIHAILENFFGELRGDGVGTKDISDEKKEDMVRRAANKYLNSLGGAQSISKRTEILLDRLCRAAKPVVDGLCDELENCKFLPEFFELKIGNEDENLPRPAAFKTEDGKTTYVYGSIDRLDTYSHSSDVYVRVIDYKTGNKTFSPDDIDEGRNLQMFLYLKAVVESDSPSFKNRLGVGDGGRIIPAGVIYVKTDMSDVTVAHADKDESDAALRKKQERRGMLLYDEISLDAMNKDYLPIKFKKDGTPDARGQKYLYSLDGWDELSEKISDKVCEISKKMKSGDIKAADKKESSACEYCKFKPICRKP